MKPKKKDILHPYQIGNDVWGLGWIGDPARGKFKKYLYILCYGWVCCVNANLGMIKRYMNF